jgi:hypothetical protein
MSYVYTQLCVLWVATRALLFKPRPSDIGGHASAGEGRADHPGDPLRAAA